MNYKISELAKLAGISTRTLRHYDDIGLLPAKRKKDSIYRIYDSKDVDLLQHILILKEMEFDLDHIKTIMKNINHEKRILMFEKHLYALNEKKMKINTIIKNVENTIKAMKGEKTMNDYDKFEGLKDHMIQKNDDEFKDEVIRNWGQEAYDSSKKAFKHFTKETYDAFQELALKIITTLKLIQSDNHNEELRKQVYELHKKWLTIAWGGTYHPEAHKNLVEMYVSDERFKAYYDQHGEGLAEILRDAVIKYT
jgi:DNA-binding transcriptional MerR regulator